MVCSDLNSSIHWYLHIFFSHPRMAEGTMTGETLVDSFYKGLQKSPLKPAVVYDDGAQKISKTYQELAVASSEVLCPLPVKFVCFHWYAFHRSMLYVSPAVFSFEAVGCWRWSSHGTGWLPSSSVYPSQVCIQHNADWMGSIWVCIWMSYNWVHGQQRKSTAVENSIEMRFFLWILLYKSIRITLVCPAYVMCLYQLL